VTIALKTGPYGRCVYESDNDVVDNQVVNMLFKSGTTASFTMIAFSKDICTRKTKIFGSLGELNSDGNKIEVFDFLTGQAKQYSSSEIHSSGHGGGDSKLLEAFLKSLSQGDQSHVLSGSKASLESHILVFASEESRKKGSVVKIQDFRSQNGIR